MTAWLTKARAAIARDVVTDLSYRVTFVMELGDGLLMLLSYVFLSRVFGAARPDGYDALAFVLVGIAVSGGLATVAACFALGLRGMTVAGSIKAVMATPTSPSLYLIVSSIYPILRAVADVVLMLACAAMFGLRFTSAAWFAAAFVLVLGLLAMAVLGVLAAAFTVVFKRGNPAAWFISATTWLLSGVIYPTSVLPRPLAALAWWLPTTHTIDGARMALIGGGDLRAIAPHACFLGVFALAGLPMALWTFAAAIRYAKRTGTLGHA